MHTLEPVALPADAVEVGRIVDAWGVKGWFKVQPYSADPQALFSSRRWLIQPRATGPQAPGHSPAQTAKPAASAAGAAFVLPISDVREHSDGIVACSREIADRTAAEPLRGARVFVPRSSFPTPAADEYYWVDLIGLEVVNREGVALGRVHELMATGPGSVLVLRDEAVQPPVERMIPFVAAYVDAVDLPGRRITVDWQADD